MAEFHEMRSSITIPPASRRYLWQPRYCDSRRRGLKSRSKLCGIALVCVSGAPFEPVLPALEQLRCAAANASCATAS